MKKSFITLTALLIVGFMATSAFAWGHGNGKRGGCGGQGQAIYNNLTDDQKTQLRDLRQEWVDTTYETRSKMMIKHQELRMLMETSKPSRDAIQALSNDIFDLKKSLADKRIDFALKAKEIAPELDMMMAFGPKGKHGRKGGHGEFKKCMGKGKGMRKGNNGTPCPYAGDNQQVTQ